MYHDLTEGKISRSLLLFALPMMAGNLLQQFYNIADTLIVGRVLGSNALAAVGSAYTLMTFLTSIFLGLSMGSGALFSIYKGKNDQDSLRNAIVHAFALIMAVTVLLNVLVYIGIDPILHFLRVPDEVWDGMKAYLLVIFAGIIVTVQLLFLSAPCTWEFHDSAGISCGLCCPEYRTGSFVRGCTPMGYPWCRTGNGDRTVCFRHRHYALCTAEMP